MPVGNNWKITGQGSKVSYQPSIILVSEKRLVRSTLGSTLEKTGFSDVRCADSAENALALLDMRNADIVITEWLMAGIDGLTLTQIIKKRDCASERYTAVVLYSACDNPEDIVKAFDADIHDFISKPVNTTVLAARIGAAAKICQRINQTAPKKIPEIITATPDVSGIIQDPETGLWNLHYLDHQLSGMLKNSRARDIMTTCAVIGIDEFQRMTNSYGKPATLELVSGLAECIKRNLRPLDVIARVRTHSLAIAIQSNNNDTFDQTALFLRIIKSVNRQTIRTSAGNIAITVSVGVESCPAQSPDMNSGQLLEICMDKMMQANTNGGNCLVA